MSAGRSVVALVAPFFVSGEPVMLLGGPASGVHEPIQPYCLFGDPPKPLKDPDLVHYKSGDKNHIYRFAWRTECHAVGIYVRSE